MKRETAERYTILRGLVGSTVHGLNVNGGIEDRDEMGKLWAPQQPSFLAKLRKRDMLAS